MRVLRISKKYCLFYPPFDTKALSIGNTMTRYFQSRSTQNGNNHSIKITRSHLCLGHQCQLDLDGKLESQLTFKLVCRKSQTKV